MATLKIVQPKFNKWLLEKVFTGDVLRLTRQIVFAVLLLCIITLCCAGTASAGPSIKAFGSLTSVEDDGTVIITVSGHTDGYLVDPSIRVVNRKGKSCSLNELTLPAGISFEYIISSTGPVIQRIKELNR
jgi:hypothetical protein